MCERCGGKKYTLESHTLVGGGAMLAFSFILFCISTRSWKELHCSVLVMDGGRRLFSGRAYIYNELVNIFLFTAVCKRIDF